MIEITVWTDSVKDKMIVDTEEEATEMHVELRLQMDRGLTVVFGNNLINPKHIRAVSFKRIEEKGEDRDSQA